MRCTQSTGEEQAAQLIGLRYPTWYMSMVSRAIRRDGFSATLEMTGRSYAKPREYCKLACHRDLSRRRNDGPVRSALGQCARREAQWTREPPFGDSQGFALIAAE